MFKFEIIRNGKSYEISCKLLIGQVPFDMYCCTLALVLFRVSMIFSMGDFRCVMFFFHLKSTGATHMVNNLDQPPHSNEICPCFLFSVFA